MSDDQTSIVRHPDARRMTIHSTIIQKAPDRKYITRSARNVILPTHSSFKYPRTQINPNQYIVTNLLTYFILIHKHYPFTMSANLPLIKECFKNINLTPKHAKVYLSLLKNGLSNISRIAKETEIPRSSCYLLIEDLKKQQLVLQQKTKYIAANPEKIAYHLETRQVELTYLLDEFTQNLPKLKTLSMGKRPKIKVLPID